MFFTNYKHGILQCLASVIASKAVIASSLVVSVKSKLYNVNNKLSLHVAVELCREVGYCWLRLYNVDASDQARSPSMIDPQVPQSTSADIREVQQGRRLSTADVLRKYIKSATASSAPRPRCAHPGPIRWKKGWPGDEAKVEVIHVSSDQLLRSAGDPAGQKTIPARNGKVACRPMTYDILQTSTYPVRSPPFSGSLLNI
ncbi:hypothetical protein BDZ91DRAFT_759521 [Kalaharituber pfeilii]|nr:hypothetical protein BDZ91DRAFT_759521 [Kalaharituber pfeilii]